MTMGREEMLEGLHPLFRTVDAGFQVYIDLVSANPSLSDNNLEAELRRRGVEPALAQELVSFVPIAFGREVVQQLGVKCSDLYRMHNLLDGSEMDLPLANEVVFCWAKAMIGEYRNADRNEIFMLIASRSAELDAVNNALHGGVSGEQLRECTLGPALVSFHRAAVQS
jgi:hypothetical protein